MLLAHPCCRSSGRGAARQLPPGPRPLTQAHSLYPLQQHNCSWTFFKQHVPHTQHLLTPTHPPLLDTTQLDILLFFKQYLPHPQQPQLKYVGRRLVPRDTKVKVGAGFLLGFVNFWMGVLKWAGAR